MSLPVIIIKNLEYKGGNYLGLYFPFDFKLKEQLKKIEGATWSATNKCWFLPNTPHNLSQLFATFKGTAWLDLSQLNRQQHKKEGYQYKYRKPLLSVYKAKVSKGGTAQIEKTMQRLAAEGFSPRSISVYQNMLKVFLGYSGKEADELTQDDVLDFQYNFWIKNKYSNASQRQFIAALKHLMADVAGKQLDPEMLVLPKRERNLPRVLSVEEVVLILKNVRNLKHLVILSLLYSAGLRISELINLQVIDIDFNRKQLHLRKAKGRKDRYVGLSKYLEPTLHQYILSYKPDIYLFNGQVKIQYSASSVRKFLDRAAKQAGILKKVHPHMLRHSYATHMLENGIDIRHIQELLGHSKPETTMIYTHVTTKQLTDIKSPLDTIIEKLTSDNANPNDPKFLISGK